LTVTETRDIKRIIAELGGMTNRLVEVFVTSQNALKVQAAKSAVTAWIQELFKHDHGWKIVEKGFESPSEIDEQPHSINYTKLGATNRLHNMKNELSKLGLIHKNTDGVVRVLVSLENGLMLENVPNVKNPNTFALHEQSDEQNNAVWVDRCVEVGEIWFQDKMWCMTAISQGVTTPANEVLSSEKSAWTKTAGAFIAEKYGYNAKDWHGSICGKGRQTIMEELTKSAFGLPYSISIPQQKSNFIPEVYHQYVTESVDFFASAEVHKMLLDEKQNSSSNDAIMWRDYYSTISQPNKMGADGINPPNSNGVIITEDLLVCYFDQVGDQDVLHAILVWAKPEEGLVANGWVLPGKRDRAYDKNKGDISIEDADFSLVEKEIHVNRSEVAYHFVIGYFDDRKREQRMKSSGFVSFVLLDKKPELIPGVRIGLPMNALLQLVRHEIAIPRYPQSSEMYNLIRNHDSLLLNIFETTKFYHIMDKMKIVQAKWRDLLKTNPEAKRPTLSEFDTGYDCQICSELLINTTIICKNGHCICGLCTEKIRSTNNPVCPNCRRPILSENIPNRILEEIIQKQYPAQYAERHNQVFGQQPQTWKNDATFNGNHIQYRF